MQIKNLTMRARAIIDGFNAGIHRSTLRGFSVEFAEYRPYVLGDDPRNLDWKLLARSDRYYIKQYEDETNRRCYLAVDQSGSMDFGNGENSKADYAKTLAATLAFYLNLQRDAVGLMTFCESGNQFIPPRHRTGHLQQIMRLLEQTSTGGTSGLGDSLASLAQLSKRRGLVILFSDLLVEPESLQQALGYLRGRGHEVIFVRILDPREVSLSLDESTMVEDVETGQEIFIDPKVAKTDYRKRLLAHEQQLLAMCHRRSARLITVTTDQPFDIALFEIIMRRGSVTIEDTEKHFADVSKNTPARTREEV